jgi:antitoxin (DNA-binding transcriptional repressor) of toxin-antitoxin stability system
MGHMTTITQRQLRNESAAITDRAERGEVSTITRNGRPWSPRPAETRGGWI